MMLIPKKYYAVLLLLGAVSRITRELQIHTEGTCQIGNSAFVIVGIPTSANDTINFTETCKYRIQNIMCEEKANQKETIKVSAERLRAVLPKGMDSQKTEDFIIRACEHYRKYLRNRDRDSR